MEIITNRQPRLLMDFDELPDKEKSYWESLLSDPREQSYVKYKNSFYIMGDFMRTSHFGEYWHGYHSDSFYSGILVHLCDDSPDHVVMGTYYS